MYLWNPKKIFLFRSGGEQNYKCSIPTFKNKIIQEYVPIPNNNLHIWPLTLVQQNALLTYVATINTVHL